jgi:hypothetical protein
MSVPKRFKFKKIYLKAKRVYTVKSLNFFKKNNWYAEADLFILFARSKEVKLC